MAYIAFSFRNSLHHWHLHIIGAVQNDIHEMLKEYYDSALEVADYFAERALTRDGEEVRNFNDVLKDGPVSQFPYATKNEYTIEEFSKEFDITGNEFLEALQMTRDSVEEESIKSDIDAFVSKWDNDINYLNYQRLKGLK